MPRPLLDSHVPMCSQIPTALRHRRWPVLFSLGVMLALGVLGSGCGGSGASQDELDRARKQGAAKARQQAKIRQIQTELRELRGGAGGGSGPSHAPTPAPAGSASPHNCGAELSANQNTTCGFAANVRDAYYRDVGSGSGTVTAWSPSTQRYYDMYCTAGSPHECTGGNNAAVYFP